MPLTPIDPSNISQYQKTQFVTPRESDGLPPDFQVKKLLGKGSNNAVYLIEKKKENKTTEQYVLRQPRRKSDTQRISNATWEFKNTMIASSVGATPEIYDAWYNRHATEEQRSGLYFLMAYYPLDIHELLTKHSVFSLSHYQLLKEQSITHLRKMAENSMFMYDLKPSNMVVRKNPLDIRFIDFGRDFCEWRPYTKPYEFTERAPVLSSIQKIADENCDEIMSAEQLYIELSFMTMVIILSSNIAYTLEETRSALRCGFAERWGLNYMGEAVAELRQQLHPKYIALIKEVLRHRDVKDTMRHYMGRRNSGTKRCFTYASFRNKRC